MTEVSTPQFAAARALFLDVDGTLLEIASTPDEVVVPAALVALLGQLHKSHDGAVALVSGRPVAQLDALFAPLVLPAAGLHGLEYRQGGRSISPIPPPDPVLWRKLRSYLTDFTDRYAGIFHEDKGRTLALHYRQAPHFELQAREAAAAALQMLGPEWELLEGKKVLELKPRAFSKGAAIARFMLNPPFAGRFPVFIGDDHTDERGFAYVNQCGGLSIHVGTAPETCARQRLPSVAAVHAWLQPLVATPVDPTD